MIGVIKRDNIFEFRDEEQLCRALSWYGDKYGCEVVIVTDRSDRIKAIINRGSFTFTPSLSEETNYLLYGLPNSRVVNVVDLQRNDSLPTYNSYELMLPFIYVSQPIPKPLDV